MPAKPVIILISILSLLLQQAAGFAMALQHSPDTLDYSSALAIDSAHNHHEQTGQTQGAFVLDDSDVSDDSDLSMHHPFCYALSASACCLVDVLAQPVVHFPAYSHSWPLAHSEILRHWSSDIEPRPPRFAA